MNNRQLIESILSGMAEDIRKDQQAKNMRASGKSAQSLQPVVEENSGALTGSAHLYFQIYGRKPGPFKEGMKTMLEWIKQKGITPKDKTTTLNQLAFLFARKVSQRGNDIFLGKRPGLDTPGIIAKWQKTFLEQFRKNLKDYVYGDIN